MSEFRSVARASSIEEGDIVAVEVDGTEMVLYRSGGELYATERFCVHQRADLVEGIVSRGFLVCAQHGWRFHADSGVHEMSPMTCLATYAVRVEGDDVQIDPTPIRRGEAPT